MIAKFATSILNKKGFAIKELEEKKQIGTLIACGMVAGAALLDVLLAIPFSIFKSPDALMLVGSSWQNYGVFLSLVTTLLLAAWFIRTVCSK